MLLVAVICRVYRSIVPMLEQEWRWMGDGAPAMHLWKWRKGVFGV